MNQQSTVYHVKYAGAGWQVFDRNAQSVSRAHRTQVEAVLHAKTLARRIGFAKIVVYGEHDAVVSEFDYHLY